MYKLIIFKTRALLQWPLSVVTGGRPIRLSVRNVYGRGLGLQNGRLPPKTGELTSLINCLDSSPSKMHQQITEVYFIKILYE